MGAPTSMNALLGRRLDIAEQEQLLKMFAKILRRGGRLTERETEIQRLLSKLQYNRDYVGRRYVSRDDAIEELLALDAVEKTRPLTHVEAERRGELVAREQRWAPARQQRIARLQAELALLETLELAEKGTVAAIDAGADLDMVRGSDGVWSPERVAA